MLLKFSTASERVKSVAFHPIRPFILVGLHSGYIQVWDYVIATMVAKFDGHTSGTWFIWISFTCFVQHVVRAFVDGTLLTSLCKAYCAV